MKHFICLLIALCMMFSTVACGSTTWQEQYDLGIRYLSEGNYKEAIIAFTSAIEIDSKDERAYLDRAEAYLRLENEPAAMADIEDALSLISERNAETPMSAEAVQQLAEAMSDIIALTKNQATLRDILRANLPEELFHQLFDYINSIKLQETFTLYQTKSVTRAPFVTYQGDEPVPAPTDAAGFISGCMRDVDCDGERELISAWSDGKNIYLQQTDIDESGQLQETRTDLLRIDYSNRIQIALYHRPNTDQWLIAVGENIVHSTTATRGVICQLYQIINGEVQRLNRWEYLDTKSANFYLDTPEAVAWQLESFQWPIDYSEYMDIQTGDLDSLTYLVQTKTSTEAGDGMWDYTNAIYSQQFCTEEELMQHSLPDRNIVGSHARELTPAQELIGQPLSAVTASYGTQYVIDGVEGGFVLIYDTYDIGFIFSMEPPITIQCIEGHSKSNFGNGVRGGMTYPEMVELLGDKAVISEPSKFENLIDEWIEYTSTFTLSGYDYTVTWLQDPYTNGSESIIIYGK